MARMTTHVAVVLGPEGVRTLTAADSERGLMERLADYVRENAELMLWPTDARTVSSFLADGLHREAVEHYFRTVGRRWEREVLETAVVSHPTRAIR